MSLQIIQAKPNPSGKEASKGSTPDRAQILGEWVDVKNAGSDPIRFSTIQVRHMLFDDACFATTPERYWEGDTEEFLNSGDLMRIHTGRESDAHMMEAEDRVGADRHVYIGSDDFRSNNRCGDRLR